MSDSLGLSIGVAHLVAAHAGRAPVARSPVVTLFENAPTEVGLPEENPNLTHPGLVLRGFVERVGDRTPLVAADGTKYLGEVLTVEAIEAMARTVGYGTPVTIAIPAYWSEARATALSEEFFAQPDLARRGVPPALVSDAVAALTALRAQPGLPADGVVALCDFGAGGTSITLFDAGSAFRQIGPTVRDTDFSGDALDQLVLSQAAASTMTTDVAGTARIGSQARLLAECRRAKEQLSGTSVAAVAGPGGDVVLSRSDFEQLLSPALDRFIGGVGQALRDNGITQLAALAAVGGGAAIPLLGARLSAHFGVPVHSAPQPGFSAAVGAALLG
ncbi:Hsp70 family protein, partial [Mycobacterium bohemicum]